MVTRFKLPTSKPTLAWMAPRILNNSSVDVVHFTTSPGFRPRHVLEAVQAGKHVFAEKPVCADPAGWRICKEPHELAKKMGPPL